MFDSILNSPFRKRSIKYGPPRPTVSQQFHIHHLNNPVSEQLMHNIHMLCNYTISTLPSFAWELAYPIEGTFEDGIPFPKVRYVSLLEGIPGVQPNFLCKNLKQESSYPLVN